MLLTMSTKELTETRELPAMSMAELVAEAMRAPVEYWTPSECSDVWDDEPTVVEVS